jgi:hypothetical protein
MLAREKGLRRRRQRGVNWWKYGSSEDEVDFHLDLGYAIRHEHLGFVAGLVLANLCDKPHALYTRLCSCQLLLDGLERHITGHIVTHEDHVNIYRQTRKVLDKQVKSRSAFHREKWGFENCRSDSQQEMDG